jgi:RimJ/RimL family protein N-acetyltransferase
VTASRLPFPLTLRGDGIVLREWRSDDLDDLVVMLDDPDIARWTPMPSPFDVEAGIAYLKRAYQGLLLRIDPGNMASTAVARRCGYRLTGEPPILQEGPYGPTSLDTWELVEGRAGTRMERLRNVAARRYGRRT